MKRTRTLLAIAVVLASNIFVLIGVAGNRSGAPFTTIELTERELGLRTLPEDDSGITLALNWREPPDGVGPQGRFLPKEFDCPKLRELGFNCAIPSDESAARFQIHRELFIALEYDGESWTQWLKSREESDKNESRTSAEPRTSGTTKGSEWLRRGASRLIILDIARSAAQLRSRHPDDRRVLITRALVGARLLDEAGKPKAWRGYVSAVIPAEIHVPVPFAKQLSGLGTRKGEEPRYTVTLRYGRKLEPWVTDVKLLAKR